jgi:hypothetical protein
LARATAGVERCRAGLDATKLSRRDRGQLAAAHDGARYGSTLGSFLTLKNYLYQLRDEMSLWRLR